MVAQIKARVSAEKGAERSRESAIPAKSVVQMIQTEVILKCHPAGAELQILFEGTDE